MKKTQIKFVVALLLIIAILSVLGYRCVQQNRKIPESPLVNTPVTEDEALNESIVAGKGVPVLLYHQVFKGSGSEDYGNISYEKFIKQLDILQEGGYTTITLNDLYDYVTSNKKLPPKPVVLTFDDTNNSDYEIVYPELLKRDYFGVFLRSVKKLVSLSGLIDCV